MKFQLIYFTGTGNTKRVLDIAKDTLLKQGHIVNEYDVSKDDIVCLSETDAIIIFYPIYAFNAPKLLINYVKKIDKSVNKIPCIIMKQSGEYLFFNRASSIYLTRLLKRRNIVVTNEYHYLMPYSFIFRHSDYMAYRMYSTMENLVPIDLEHFLNHEEAHIDRFFLSGLFAFIFRIQWLGGKLNGIFYKVDKEKCIGCNKCIDNCPNHNITFKDGEYKFNFSCLMCQRCVMYCPTHAIKPGFFNGWRVDKPYTFNDAPYQEEIKPNFCKKSYQKYFIKAENEINNHNKCL